MTDAAVCRFASWLEWAGESYHAGLGNAVFSAENGIRKGFVNGVGQGVAGTWKITVDSRITERLFFYILYQRPNLLLLDKPTNHLDFEMRQAYAVALRDFSGALVIVSHDNHLLRVTRDRLMLVHDDRDNDFPLRLDECPKWLSEPGRQSAVDSTDADRAGDESAKSVAKTDRRRTEAE